MSAGVEEAGGLRDGSLERLRYRRQFFLGPRYLDGRTDWTRVAVDGRNLLTVHPDLEVTRVGGPERSITLLGYLLDPENPEATNADILRALLRDASPVEACIESTDGLGGRWALIVHDGRDTVIFHDAAGQRQVHFAWDASASAVVAASQPGLIAAALGLARDPAALDFMSSRIGGDGSVFWMPGDRTTYREIRALLPNHLLDLGTGRPRRYWPLQAPPEMADGDPVPASARLLRGQLEAARRRFELVLSMTAGWDSRLMLALSRDRIDRISCYTMLGPGTPAGSRDVVVPGRLLARLGVPHRVLAYPDQVDQDFRRICRTNVDAVKEAWSADVQAIHQAYPGDRVCITGDVAEIVKCYYRTRGGRAASPLELARLTEIGEFPFAIEAFREWLAGAQGTTIPLLDLFCWEQMAGRWQALIRAEYDVVQESFAPLNCRKLLRTMLAVGERERRPPRYRFFRSLIGYLWSDVLGEPINPREPVSPRALAGRLLRSLRIYDLVPDRFKRRAPPPGGRPPA